MFVFFKPFLDEGYPMAESLDMLVPGVLSYLRSKMVNSPNLRFDTVQHIFCYLYKDKGKF